MQLKTILNHVTQYKSFVFTKVNWVEEEDPKQPALEVAVEPRKNGRPVCSGCSRRRPGYDQATKPRRFQFVPLWGISVYLVYRMRRVECPQCGVKVERVPWVEGKSTMTVEYQWFLARSRQTHVVEGSRRRVPRELGSGLRSGKSGGFLGIGAPQPRRHRGDRRGRSAMETGPPIPNGRVPTR